jgi:hypothetical protein
MCEHREAIINLGKLRHMLDTNSECDHDKERH